MSEAFVQDRKGAWRIACAGLVLGLCFGGAASAQQINFQRIAGGAEGDGGAPLQANLTGASDAVYDGAGNLYISQSGGNRIRRITPGGVITTVAGGSSGFGGDGGPASAAKIDRPSGLAFDSAGNLYFADGGNRRVRRIDPYGTITTVAGNGARSHSGDGGGATMAGFASVDGLAVDASNNLYVADLLSHVVRKITLGGIITTVAGTPNTSGYAGDMGQATSALLNEPTGIAVDPAGNLYIADVVNSAIRRVATDGTITTLWAMDFTYPINVSTDAAGNVYWSDTASCRLYKRSGNTTSIIAGMAGCGPTVEGAAATMTRIGTVDGIAVDSQDRVVFVDWDMARVRRVGGGVITTIAGTGGEFADGRAAIGAPLGFGNGIAIDTDGDVLVVDAGYRRVRRITPNALVYSPAGNGWFSEYGPECPDGASSCPGKSFPITVPVGIAPGTIAGQILVADRAMDRIYAVDSATNVLSVYAGASSGTIGADGPIKGSRIDPWGMARSPSGDLYFADYRANKVRRIVGDQIVTVAGTGAAGSGGDGGPATSALLYQPLAVAVDASDSVYVSEAGGLRVRRFSASTPITTIAGNGQVGVSGDGGAATAAAVGRVTGIAVHDSSNGTDVYLASEGTLRRVRAGVITTLPGWTHYAMGLAIEDGQLYVTTQEGDVYRGNLGARAAHDYDGDGRSDILWRNANTGADVIWKSANINTQIPMLAVAGTAWKIVGQGDFDGDGRDDVVWRNATTGANRIWGGANSVVQLHTSDLPGAAWSIVGVGDFNQDGASDLVWRNATSGANSIWFSGSVKTPITTVPVQWKLAGVGDFDGDGGSDLLWRNTTTGQNRLWRSGNSLQQLSIADVGTLSFKVAGVGDFNGDGRADVLWRNTANGQNVVWDSANIAQTHPITAVTQQAWKVAAVGDYDGDGKADLLWRFGTNGTNVIWKGAVSTQQLEVTDVTSLAWSVMPYEFQP